MGYAGKLLEQHRARELRAQSWTLADIATELGVSKSSVSAWVRDVDFVPRPRNRGHRSMKPHPHHVRKLEEIERCRLEGAELIGTLSEREFLVLGAALYAGEGSKRPGEVRFANSDPRMLLVFATWLRRFVKPYRAVADATLRRNRHLAGCAAIAYTCSLTHRRVMGMVEAVLSPSAVPG